MRLIYIFVILTAVFGESVYGIYLARVGRSTPTKQSGMKYLNMDDNDAFNERLRNNDHQDNEAGGYDFDEYPGLREHSQSRIPPYDRRNRRLHPLSGPFSNDGEYDPSNDLPIPVLNLLNSRRRPHLRSNTAPGSQPICKDGNCDITWPDPLSGEFISDNHFEAAASGKWPPSDTNGPSFPSQLSYVQFLSSPSRRRNNGNKHPYPRHHHLRSADAVTTNRPLQNTFETFIQSTQPGEEHFQALKEFSIDLLKHELEYGALKAGLISGRDPVEINQQIREFYKTKCVEFFKAHGNENGKKWAEYLEAV